MHIEDRNFVLKAVENTDKRFEITKVISSMQHGTQPNIGTFSVAWPSLQSPQIQQLSQISVSNSDVTCNSTEQNYFPIEKANLKTEVLKPDDYSVPARQEPIVLLPSVVTSRSERRMFTEVQENFSGKCNLFSRDINNTECSTPPGNICHGCKTLIKDPWIYKIDNNIWHEKCKTCFACGKILKEKCYVYRGKLYCKEDYQNMRKQCDECGLTIANKTPAIIMKVMPSEYAFHTTCFICSMCKKEIRPREKAHYTIQEFHDSRSIIWQCEHCWFGTTEATINHIQTLNDIKPTASSPGVSSENTDLNTPESQFCVFTPKSGLDNYNDDVTLSSDDESVQTAHCSVKNEIEAEQKLSRIEENGAKKSKRARTILTTEQRKMFKLAFEATPKPCRKTREQLAQSSKLHPRVVQVWFQNQRAKMKKIQKRKESDEATVRKMQKVLGYSEFKPFSHEYHLQGVLSGREIMIEPHSGHIHDHHMALQSHILFQPIMTPWDIQEQDISMLPSQVTNSCNYSNIIHNTPSLSQKRHCENMADFHTENPLSNIMVVGSGTPMKCDNFQLNSHDVNSYIRSEVGDTDGTNINFSTSDVSSITTNLY